MYSLFMKDDCPLSPEDKCVGLARVGTDFQKIIYCSLKEMSQLDLGPPLHSLIICGKLHPMELEFVNMYANP